MMNLLMELDYFQQDKTEKIKGLRIDTLNKVLEFNNGSEWIKLATLKDTPPLQEKDEKDAPDGYSSLDENGLIPNSNLPDQTKQGMYLVETLTERDAISNQINGDIVFVKSVKRSYIWDDEVNMWRLQSVLNRDDIAVLWENIANKPTAFTPEEHGNDYHTIPFAKQEDLDALQNQVDSQKGMTFEQSTLSKTWVVNHNLSRKPHVTVLDTEGNLVYGSVKYIDFNTLEIHFKNPFRGKAIIK